MEWGRRLQAPPLDLSATRKAVTASDLGAVDRALTKKVLDLNAVNKTIEAIQMDHDPLPTGTAMISNRTGLRDSLATLKERARVAREKSMAASDKLTEAFAHQQRVTESLEQYADDVLKESNEVLAELGQFSNGGPA